jgi:hypothetical protein
MVPVAGLVLAIGAVGALWAFRPQLIPIDTETETQIDAAQPCVTTVSRFAPDPAIIVVDFPDLTVQGLTLNRVAALVEKARLPRDRVLDDASLAEAIYDCGDTIESYYYGHDYQAADLARFFALADADHISLNPHELWLRQLVMQLGWMTPGATGALISLPGAAPPITEDMRAIILHHEISHGAFYTIPAYADYATLFWNHMTQAQRDGFTGFLGRKGYDTTDTRLMLNETQAYLVFTHDPRFFRADVVGMTQADMDQLRLAYIAGMADFWLRPMAVEALPVGLAPAMCAVHAS